MASLLEGPLLSCTNGKKPAFILDYAQLYQSRIRLLGIGNQATAPAQS
jgi:hypothetical protein